MKKLIAKIVESYAKTTATSSGLWFFHAVKVPKSLIK